MTVMTKKIILILFQMAVIADKEVARDSSSIPAGLPQPKHCPLWVGQIVAVLTETTHLGRAQVWLDGMRCGTWDRGFGVQGA